MKVVRCASYRFEQPPPLASGFPGVQPQHDERAVSCQMRFLEDCLADPCSSDMAGVRLISKREQLKRSSGTVFVLEKACHVAQCRHGAD